MKWLLLLALCACNQVLGLSTPAVVDAQQFDAPHDAPFACPAVGDTPQFSPRLHQQIEQNCYGYMVGDNGRAVAQCDGVISEGDVDAKLSPVPGLPMTDARYGIDGPRLSPEGEDFVVGVYDYDIYVNEFRVYHRDLGGTWTFTEKLPFGEFGGGTSAMTRGPGRHIMFRPNLTDGLYEWAETGTGWQQVATHSLSSLGASSLGNVWLSPDGLRMVVEVDTQALSGHLVWTDRPAIDAPFRTPVALTTPHGSDSFVNADCSRLYFTGLHSVFYVQRL